MYKVYGLSRNGKGFWLLRRKGEALLRFDSAPYDLNDALEKSSNYLLEKRGEATELFNFSTSSNLAVIYTVESEEL